VRLPAVLTDLIASASLLDRNTGTFPDDAGHTQLLKSIVAAESGGDALAKTLGDTISLEQALAKLTQLPSGATLEALNALLGLFDGQPSSKLGFGTFSGFALGTATVDQDMFPTGGYRRFVTALAADLDIRLSTKVTEIIDHGQGVTVRTDTDDHDCSHVLVTVPLGVLKAGSIKFEPALAQPKQVAIDAMGFGAFEKVALVYDQPIWQVDHHPTHVLVADAHSRAWPLMLDMSAWYGKPVVVALTGGDDARRVAALPERERIGEVAAIVAQIAGPGHPGPTEWATTAWAADPFTMGCYSSMLNSNAKTYPDALAQPHGRVLFAGEATAADAYATVDGAWLSGIREAKRLLQRATVPIN